ncbi:nucleotidyltransferase domain-containing protein [Rhizobium etli 8C-3]|uniref:Nucleotidyltransferase domain-containing protein n=1 Tax=Rhizobium etli 8C-3 TaxID=538025 RepID=A0A1L5P6B2_RHIET|nr:nucleotidyltransferase [Rhizobium etli]APO75640.1 nucleotidyltransferase domain-containing protein [Rhizobium etli 8C-3]
MKSSKVLENDRQANHVATTRFNGAKPRIFGSAARGEEGLPGTTLFDLRGLLKELQAPMCGTEIHVLKHGDFPDHVRSRVLQEAKSV